MESRDIAGVQNELSQEGRDHEWSYSMGDSFLSKNIRSRHGASDRPVGTLICVGPERLRTESQRPD